MAAHEVPEGVEVLSVSALTEEVNAILEENFHSIWVQGEISNLARPKSGHLYLKLKDDRSQLSSVIFRGVALRLRFEPQDGMEVIALGTIKVYKPRGEYQLNILQLFPKGIGPLELALQQLREKLLLRGYFEPERKKPLPRYPNRIALVTSPTGAAIRDLLEILSRRWPLAEIIVRGSRVQGDGAAEDIASAIRELNSLHAEGRLPIDLMIVGRGGGSIEDLWAFNEEVVADAIYASEIPVVSAVGHEIDMTISDNVADVRAATPSHAAEMVTPDRRKVLDALLDIRARLPESLRRRVVVARDRLDDLATRRAFRLPLERIREQERRLDELNERFTRVIRQRLSREEERVRAIGDRLETLSPLKVLRRGYTLTRTGHADMLVRSIKDVHPGEIIRTRVPDGEIVSRVEETQIKDDES